MSPDYRVSLDADLQPYRHPVTGEVVTIDPHQCAAIQRALSIHFKVQRIEADKGRARQSFDSMAAMQLLGLLSKSCLMGRILYEGKAPLVDAPPTKYAAPDYSLEVPR